MLMIACAAQRNIKTALGLYHEITSVREYEMIVLARFIISSQRYDDANILLNRILVFAEEKKRNHTLVEVLNLLSITAYRSNNEQQQCTLKITFQLA